MTDVTQAFVIELTTTVTSLMVEVELLKARVEQVDRQSRCRHVWETDREDPRKRVCAECGCSPLGRQ